MTQTVLMLTDACRSERTEVAVHATPVDYRQVIEISIVAEAPDGLYVMPRRELERVGDAGCYYGGPSTLALPVKLAQALADALYHAGIRPTDSHGSAGQLGATQAHLADMRSLVSKYAECDLGEKPPR